MKKFIPNYFLPFMICLLFLAAGSKFISAAAAAGNGTGDQPSGFAGTSGDPLVVKTASGLVKGNYADQTIVWKGLPFAKRPVGNLRWKAPQEPDSWKGIKPADEFGDICPQYLTDPEDISKTIGIGGSEDCLYLNVWRPNTKESNLPVYFWIHGGGNSIQLPLHQDLSGANLSTTDNFVVVSINYRLGPLGWFTHPALKGFNAYDNSGNFGTLDIIKALEWVKKNIAAFGGNPGGVTVAGESAGGLNTFSLIMSDLAKGLFHHAVIESGMAITSSVKSGETYANGIIIKSLIRDGLVTDEASAQAYLDKMSRSDIKKYLLAQSAQDLIALNTPASGAMYIMPNIFPDGVVIPKSGTAALRDGTYPNKVPLIIGTNEDEVKLFLFMTPQFMPIALGTADADLIELYNLVSKYMTDLWKAGIDSTVRSMRAYQDNIYEYNFNWGAGGAGSVLPYPYNYALGSCHGMEIEFFFGNTDNVTGMLGKVGYTDQNLPGRTALSQAIMTYLDGLARKGDPNVYAEKLPQWQPWSNKFLNAPKSLILDAGDSDLRIQMSTEEYNALVIMGQLLREPRAQEILEVMKEMSSLII